MPKGHIAEREVACGHCDEPFRTTKVGKAARFCHRPSCDESRENARKSRLESERKARAAERRQARAEERRRRTIEKKMMKRRLEFYRPILEDWRQNKLGDDLLEVVKLASAIKPSREGLAGAIMRLRTPAVGAKELHETYQAVAAEALALADQARPRTQRTIVVEEEPGEAEGV